MALRAKGNTGVRFFTRAFACALILLDMVSCGGTDTLAPKDVVALRFVTAPTTLVAGVPFTVTVELVASGNKRVTAATDVVTLTLNGGAALNGTTTAAAVD